jgi:hypothetical protein
MQALPRLRNRHALSDSEIDDLVDILLIQADVAAAENIDVPELRNTTRLPDWLSANRFDIRLQSARFGTSFARLRTATIMASDQNGVPLRERTMP